MSNLEFFHEFTKFFHKYNVVEISQNIVFHQNYKIIKINLTLRNVCKIQKIVVIIQTKTNAKIIELIHVLSFETSNTKNVKKTNAIKSNDIFSI